MNSCLSRRLWRRISVTLLLVAQACFPAISAVGKPVTRIGDSSPPSLKSPAHVPPLLPEFAPRRQGNFDAASFTSQPLIGTVYIDSGKEFGMLLKGEDVWKTWYRSTLHYFAEQFKSAMPKGIVGFEISLERDGGRTVHSCLPQAQPNPAAIKFCTDMIPGLESRLMELNLPPEPRKVDLHIVVDGRARALTMWSADSVLEQTMKHYTEAQIKAAPKDKLALDIAASLPHSTGPAIVGSVKLPCANPLSPSIDGPYKDPRAEWQEWYKKLFAHILPVVNRQGNIGFLDYDITVHRDGYVVAKDAGGEIGRSQGHLKIIANSAREMTGSRPDLKLPADAKFEHLTVSVAVTDGELTMWSRDQVLSDYERSVLAATTRLDQDRIREDDLRVPPHIKAALKSHHIEPGQNGLTVTLEEDPAAY